MQEHPGLWTHGRTQPLGRGGGGGGGGGGVEFCFVVDLSVTDCLF